MFDLIFHLDAHLASLVQTLGPLTLAILCAVVFCETGLVVTPFLPGDSLLFAAGAVSALFPRELPVERVIFFLAFSAIFGDWLNSEVGRRFGEPVEKWLSRTPSGLQHLETARRLFQRHGGKAVIFARFLPLLRTFVPFAAGVSGMPRSSFAFFNVLGALVWVGSLVSLGHTFGNLPLVKGRFHWVIVGIIFVSLLPALIEALRTWRRSERAPMA